MANSIQKLCLVAVLGNKMQEGSDAIVSNSHNFMVIFPFS